MSMAQGLRPAAIPASGRSSGDSRETAALGAELYAAMRRGEEVSLGLLAGFSVDQMARQLQGDARLTVDTSMTHLARLDRAVALGALEDLLDAHRRRVLPEMSGRQIDLFGRLNR
jgi:hypothetical protein